ncbi:hypothetical protein DX912_00530 [Lysobacter soli]|uniref:Uncharacterized protein n=2 Tax=Lysobacter soli TaxID=453783 RepID=A0A3D8VIV4_9GAMM|nr:hypothetical protein DX912_00530 [Lysobacter soli]
MALYAVGLLCAAWIKPELQKFFLFRPRWRHGLRASPLGMTAQATVALSLSLMLGSRLTGVDMRYALWLFLASGAFSAIAWSNDAVANRERR